MSIEELLSHPHIWQGRDRRSIDADTVPTGFENLDRYLPGGGWSLRSVTEIFLERYGVGELSLLMPALSSLSHCDSPQWIVWIAPPFVPYAPALLRHGVDLSRILLVHPAGEPHDALWATEQVVRSRSSVVALAWLDEADSTALRRLQLGAEEYRCWPVLFRPMRALEQPSPAGLRIRLSRAGDSADELDSPADGTGQIADAGQARVDILKCRGRRPKSLLIEDARGRAACSRGSGWQ